MTVLDAFLLDDTVALVTGAARGLGAAGACALAEAGAHVVLAGRSRPALTSVAAQIVAANGSASVLPFDVSDETQVADAMASIGEEFGGIDVLVNNAAVQHEEMAVAVELADWNRVLSTNLTGSFLCAREFVRLKPRGPGRNIINVTSLIAGIGVKGQVAYGASKAGVVSMTRTLALELAAEGVRANALAPGYFATDMPSEILRDEQARRRLLRRIPQNRVAQPEEIGPPLVFLASRAAGYMTGATIYFDGGFTA